MGAYCKTKSINILRYIIRNVILLEGSAKLEAAILDGLILTGFYQVDTVCYGGHVIAKINKPVRISVILKTGTG